MKFTVERFEICGVEGIAHLIFTAIVDGEKIEYNQPLSMYDGDDIEFMQAVEKIVRTKVGEMND